MAIDPRLVAKVLAGLGAGGAFGYYAMPHVSGYQDVESARRLSGTMNATTMGILAALSHKAPGQLVSPLSKLLKHLSPAQKIMMPASAIGASELIPSGLAALQRSSGAMKDLAAKTETSSIPFNVKRVLESSPMRGAGAGLGLAGLGSLVTGLTRRQTEEEAMNRKTRGGMVTSDFLKYMVPAAIAGGVLGSLKQPQTE